MRLDVDLVEVGLVVAEGLSDGEFDDTVGSRQRLDGEKLATALVFESETAPEYEFIGVGRGDLEFDGLRIGGVVVPAVESHSCDMGILEPNVFEADGDGLRESLCAVPYFLAAWMSTSSFSERTLLGG